MTNLKILIGDGRAGKTTYANKVVKEGYEFISIDDNYHYGGEEDYFKFLDFVADKLNNNQNKNFVLDGYINFDKHFDYLRNKLKDHKIISILVFANYKTISERNLKLKKTRTDEEILEFYRETIKSWKFDEFVEGDGENKKAENYDDAIKIVEDNGVVEQDVINFLKRFEERQGFDKYYQTIELPFGHKIQGYNQDYEHRSLDQIKEIYDFKDKKVADIGCFTGYFCFEIAKYAKTVHGFDKVDLAIETARDIAELKQMDIKFEVFDMDKEEIKEEYDVILLLNVWQHLKNIEEDLDKIFSKAKAVILEMGFVKLKPHWSMISKERLLEIAEKHNHKLNKEIPSVRGRTILLFKC